MPEDPEGGKYTMMNLLKPRWLPAYTHGSHTMMCIMSKIPMFQNG